MIWKFLYKISSPKYFYIWSGKVIPWLKALTLLLMLVGLIMGLIFAPADYQQGDAFRIIYIHVPSAFLSLMIYSFMFFCAVLIIVWRIKLAEIMLKSSISIGATLTFIALITGAIWGKPMWGTWWIWDARLTSELILLFIYLGIYGLMNAIDSPSKAARVTSIMVIIGFVDIPIIHYSVKWWNTLHQGATISKFASPSIAPEMLYPLLIMLAAFISYSALIILQRGRIELLQREKKTKWVREILQVS